MLNILLILIALCFNSCSSEKHDDKTAEYKRELGGYFYNIRKSEDSLKIALQRSIDRKDDVSAMLAHRQLGIFQRENSRFSEAVASHQNEYELALKLNDTIEIVQALNNLGTDFRRLGALSEAAEYHYRALDYAEEFSGTDTPRGKKNRVVSLNGIGNVSLSLGFFDDAKIYFQKALEDEIILESPIGQAINYANIGSIYEQTGKIDSARMFYELSLEQNILGKSDMGVGLCYIHFGNLYKNEGKYEEAKAEYQKAYDLMENISDRWHWLEACLSIAEIHLLTNNFGGFNKYINLAEETATDIKSPEHLSVVYRLKHNFDIQQKNYYSALQNFKLSMNMLDSVQGVKKGSQYMDLRVNYERSKYTRNLQQIEAENKAERERKQLTLYALWLAVFAAISFTVVLYYAFIQRTRSNKILRELEKARSDFFTGITHEFRTPLTVILGLAENIKEKKPDTKDAIEIIRQGNILLNMVNQLLDMAKLKSSVDLSKWVYGNISVFVEMSVEVYKSYAATKSIDIIFKSEESILFVDFVPVYFNKIIGNLLSNAIKHTPNGGKVFVKISKENSRFILSVADTGSGILPEDLDHIFEEYYQGSNNYGNEPGTGIGLAITKKMVEIMNGTITADNRPEGGAEFILNIPLKQNIEVDEKWNISDFDNEYIRTDEIYKGEEYEFKDSELTVVGDESAWSVLIIEDNRDIRHYIGSLLEDKYTLRFATNGEEGISKAREFMPDLIITDLMMPVMDGFSLCRAVRENEILNHIPIIVITAKTTDEDKQLAIKSGADAYLYKPFSAAELRIRVKKLLEQRQALREKYSKAMIEGNYDKVELSNSDHKFLNRIITIVYEQISDKDLNTDVVAEAMNMSRSQLNRKVRYITGYSTSAYILHIRLEKAKRMLKTDDTPVSDIAMSCGFDDSSYFSRVFRQVYKITPTQFRKKPA